MYLEHDLVYLFLAVVWFFIGVRVFRRVPLLHDPMVVFSRHHPYAAPFVVFLLVVFWPISKVVWRFVFFCCCKLARLMKGKQP